MHSTQAQSPGRGTRRPAEWRRNGTSYAQRLEIVTEQGMRPIAIGDGGDGKRPVDGKPRIIVADAAFACGRPRCRMEIQQLRIVAERLEAMGEAFRDEHLA